MKRFFVFVVCCVLCVELCAVPAKPVVKDSVLADGSVVQMVLRGDEFGHYYEPITDNSVQITDSRRQIIERREQAKAKRRVSKRAPHQAERGLVILVEFSDVSFVKSVQNFDDLLNKEGYDYNGATGSAKDYFRDASNGKYVPQFDVYGPYKLDKEMSYYGQNDRDGLDLHPDQMVVDAVAKLDSAENINFADYDTDNDGNIDNIFIYYAGYGENEGAPENTVWPHAWEVYDGYVTGQLVYDGKQIKGYACTSELQGIDGVEMCGIGTFCHEFGHVLGLPDFYVTDYSSSHKTLGDWDIMDSGSYLNDGNTPPTYSAHERFYLGWLTPEILNADGDFELEELQKSNKAYIITETGEHNLNGGNPNSKTYYLLENRQKVGWDEYLPGHGLMLTKTVYDENKWYNNVPNNMSSQQGYDLIEADGKTLSGSSGKGGDLFPGSANISEYTLCDIYHISGIMEKDSVINFSLEVNDDISGGGEIYGDCFEETFDNLIGESSVDITADMDDYADNAGWEGYKLFCSAGELKVGSSKYAGYVITPKLGFEGDVRVEFEGRGYNADAIIKFEVDGVVAKSVNVSSTSDIYTFDLDGLSITSRIKISADVNRFYINNFKVCKEQDVPTIVVNEAENVVLIDRGGRCVLEGVNEGMVVRCFDAMGRLVWSRDIEGGEFEFDAPRGFYLLQVIDGNNVSVVKGVKN
ncbi:MAG: M6 family metalloprotease domain-containing protein [Paludibacteraceae bacterium]|nr:M6 family metalloprotease domain-containing protein [Paludibacteraceae bacterium]